MNTKNITKESLIKEVDVLGGLNEKVWESSFGVINSILKCELDKTSSDEESDITEVYEKKR